MIVSPSDVLKEREIAKNVLYRWNEINSRTRCITFSVLGYDINAHADSGCHPQESLNHQLLEQADLIIAIFWTKLGTPTKFCVKTTITAEDEWLHSFYYFNDEIPTDKDFEKTVGDYLTFEFSMIMQGRKYLFENDINKNSSEDVNTEKLEDKEWKPFEIAKLFKKFEQGKSKGLNHLDEKNGVTPYLGATNRNNGVLTFIKDDEILKQKGNCIGFIRNGQGSVGFAIYKEEEFVSTSDNTFAYANWLNRFTGLFVVTAQDLIRSKYSFGYKRNNERLKKDKILLPTDLSGNPDYHYMENYIKKLMHRKYTEYLNFKKK